MLIGLLLLTTAPFLCILVLSYLCSDVGTDAVFKHDMGWWPCITPVLNIAILIALILLLLDTGPHQHSRLGRRQ